MSDKGDAARDGAATVTVNEDRAARQERETQVRHACQVLGVADRAESFIEAGFSQAEVIGTLQLEAQRNLKPMQAAGAEVAAKDLERYSISRAIMKRAAGEKLDGIEGEFDAEIRKSLPSDFKNHDGFMVPSRLTRAMSSAATFFRAIDTSNTGAKGTNIVFTEPGEFIDLLRPRMKVAQLGATTLTGLTGNVAFPKQSSAGAFSWVSDNPGSDLSESDLVLAQVALNPAIGQSTSAYSRLLLTQGASGNVDVDALVQQDLLRITALGIDKAAINGSGSGNEPTGILNTSSIGNEAGGTNGAVPTYANLVNMEADISGADADIGEMAWLTTPGIRGVLRNTQQFPTSANGLPVWTGGGGPAGGEVLGYRAEISTQVPSTLSKGSTSGSCHAIIFGVWSQLIIGYWGAYELVVDPYSKKKQALIELTSYQVAGLAVRHPESFTAMQDATLS